MLLKRWISLTLALAIVAVLAWLITQRLLEGDGQSKAGSGGERNVPVEVAAIEHGPIELRRTFTGTLDAHAEFVVAPKIGGRIDAISMDLADSVTRGQVVARMDNAEFVQSVAQAEADLAVAQANLGEARSQLTIAKRELQRLDKLRERGVSSESQLDLAKADQLTKQARVEVTRAQVTRAQAALETARIRLGYTEVIADWTGGSDLRLVAERYLDEGETVAANAPLLRIVELDPLIAVFFVTERDYALLHTGQRAELSTDSYPGELFPGEIVRIAPVFHSSTRQARVEVRVDNPQLRLKPGMFTRIILVLERIAETRIVPEQALVTRNGHSGLFVVAEGGGSVTWREVTVGITQGQRVQVSGENLGSRVVILGQQLLKDGSRIAIAGAAEAVAP
ncbi:MAG: efflux RND transporter periplasmic adaptor subunit [Gammaproteobacteria bacterium]|nr:efflux RND transporter periplasmic adaptor subunit [Gammaproteobacteria bacterium]